MSSLDRDWDDALDAVEAGLERAEGLVRAGTLDDLVDVLGTRPTVGSPLPSRLGPRATAALQRTRALEAVVAARLADSARALEADLHGRRPAAAVAQLPVYVDARA
ncbi:hypothetical protein [Phycicoccus sonneratiae]|uniref:Uncharacterized protein n=1 Tax=Phycicoccus sonneratiae TaxID=2807628 RepID=A0ABS2CNW3_9MICO|nr:hypothetical protein [Phycicoccus sonneraticus]MBM6401470.1 hypothetical protein [Phycicoccus sonneraticus]